VYKDSGVEWLGEIPCHWPVKPLFALFARGKSLGHASEELLSVYRDYGVIKKSSRNDNNNKPSEDLSLYQLVEPGNLVVNKMKAWQGSAAISNYRGIVSPAYFVYKSLHSENSSYLHHLMRSLPYAIGYMASSKGIRVNQWDLDPDLFRRFPILLPPFSEQIAIAAFLDHETSRIDALITKKTRFIELLREKRQALITRAVTKGLDPNVKIKDSGVEWLGEVPEHWEVMPLGWTASTLNSLFVDGDWIESQDLSDIGIRYITTGNVGEGRYKEQGSGYITDETFSRLKCTEVLPGDVLISRLNMPVGRACIVPELDERIVTSVDNVIVRPNPNFSRQFLVLLLSCDGHFANMEILARGTTMQRISRSTLGRVRFAFPPLSEQVAIAVCLNRETAQIDALIAKTEQSISLLRERRSALITAAVTGQLNVLEDSLDKSNNNHNVDFAEAGYR
jgi:type I restriction enzyme S subunit